MSGTKPKPTVTFHLQADLSESEYLWLIYSLGIATGALVEAERGVPVEQRAAYRTLDLYNRLFNKEQPESGG